MKVVEIEELRYSVRRHFWSKRKEILRGVTLAVEGGEIFGFLGPNGAGKTTTLKGLLGLLEPDGGVARLFGESARKREVRRRVGFMPERAYFPEHLSARELLVAHGILAGLTSSDARQRSQATLELVGLASVAEERLGGFSKGMQQRLGLGQALIAEPDLVVLDEPMSALDPVGRHDVREIMLRLRAEGKTVFFSTHILPDVEAICDHVAILVSGVVRRDVRLSALLSDTASQVEILFEGCSPAKLEGLRDLGAWSARGAAYQLTLSSAAAANIALDRLRAAGGTILSLQTQRRSLEEIFVAESRRRDEEAAA
jgi:ABC-2 type transport system ATP-binding protein